MLVLATAPLFVLNRRANEIAAPELGSSIGRLRHDLPDDPRRHDLSSRDLAQVEGSVSHKHRVRRGDNSIGWQNERSGARNGFLHGKGCACTMPIRTPPVCR